MYVDERHANTADVDVGLGNYSYLLLSMIYKPLPGMQRSLLRSHLFRNLPLPNSRIRQKVGVFRAYDSHML